MNRTSDKNVWIHEKDEIKETLEKRLWRRDILEMGKFRELDMWHIKDSIKFDMRHIKQTTFYIRIIWFRRKSDTRDIQASRTTDIKWYEN